MKTRILLAALWSLALCARTTVAAKPSAADQDEARRWTAAKFAGVADGGPTAARITVVENHDPVQPNTRAGRPLSIAGAQYTRGLYCHAESRLIVRLPGPARRFAAVAGVDSNDQTSGGRGSVVFSVRGERRGGLAFGGDARGHARRGGLGRPQRRE